MINDFSRMVRLLRQKNKKVIIFIAQIPPLGPKWSIQKLCGNDTTYDRAIRNLNKNIAAFAKMSTTPTSPVIVVDQFSGIDPSASMYDDIHPNDLGEKLMAERWFKAIRPYLKKLH
jgi:lysophospholipase L1-like esterase